MEDLGTALQKCLLLGTHRHDVLRRLSRRRIALVHRIDDHALHLLDAHRLARRSIAPKVVFVNILFEHKSEHKRRHTALHQAKRRLLQRRIYRIHAHAPRLALEPTRNHVFDFLLYLDDRQSLLCRVFPIALDFPRTFERSSGSRRLVIYAVILLIHPTFHAFSHLIQAKQRLAHLVMFEPIGILFAIDALERLFQFVHICHALASRIVFRIEPKRAIHHRITPFAKASIGIRHVFVRPLSIFLGVILT